MPLSLRNAGLWQCLGCPILILLWREPHPYPLSKIFARGLAVRHLLLLGKLLGNMSHSGTLCGLGSTRGSSCLGIHLRVV
jgi:hypothetical protein